MAALDSFRKLGAAAARLPEMLAGMPSIEPDPSPRVSVVPPDPNISLWGTYGSWMNGLRAPAERVNEMKWYDYLESEIHDVSSALTAYATMAVTGNLTGGGNNTFAIKTKEPDVPDALARRLRRLEKMIGVHAFACVRSMCKFGSYIPEQIIGEVDGGLGVTNIKHVPPGTMFRVIQPDGSSNKEQYWQQVIDGTVLSGGPQQKPVYIEQWRMLHFALWTNVVNATQTLLYGTSVLRSFGAIGLKVHACMDSLVVARLSRAAMRYVYKVDVSDIRETHEAILNRLRTWQQLMTRRGSIIDGTGRTDSFKKAAIPDSDFFIPAGTGLSYDLDKIDGDTNLARVNDLMLLKADYFGALGVPPEYLGHERAQGGRSNLSQLDIQFARVVRFVQLFAAAAFERMVWTDLILGGFNPEKLEVSVKPPNIGARDDLLQAQIRALQSTVLANLRNAGMDFKVNPQWILQTFMLMDEELTHLDKTELAKIFVDPEPAAADPAASKPSREDLRRIRDENTAAITRNIKMILSMNRTVESQAQAMIAEHMPSIEDLYAQLVR